MIFKMLLEGSGDHERPIVRGLLRHVVAGFAIGVVLGACGFGAILISMGDQSIQIPALFALAMMLQAGALGGFVSAGVFMSRIIDRDHDGMDPPSNPPSAGPIA